ncbi:VOC family protein [Plebeiibacterium sediminum]|uniref:VOC family protein n=1 Tax=Plebeiibacterium sediminum TaxID=2992112 RepID=A0AAE3SF02_9BACT|nr:VOC family protein [Plebeiobacterium sediminum]MCW3786512.1 VOC family protein [Plebeiobacterium sediminum]
MPVINVYLTFDGNCEDAFNYYRDVFEVEFAMINRFKDMPPQNGTKLPEGDAEKIMHVSLPISDETVLMGCDVGGEWSNDFVQGNNFSISIEADSKKDADRYFDMLSIDGEVVMPMDTTFWGSYFGMLTDQFGINWMVSFDIENSK